MRSVAKTQTELRALVTRTVNFPTIPLVLMCMQMQMQKKIACNVLGRPISIYPDVNVILDVDEILIASGSD